MRRLILVFLLCLTVLGCAKLREYKADADACLSNPVCREEAVLKASELGEKAAVFASVSPVPGTVQIVKTVTKAGGLIVFLILGGALLRKKDQ